MGRVVDEAGVITLTHKQVLGLKKGRIVKIMRKGSVITIRPETENGAMQRKILRKIYLLKQQLVEAKNEHR